MKSFESVLGEIERDRAAIVVAPLGDEDDVNENIKGKFNESVEAIVLLFEYGKMDARGYFVKTKSRVLFCLTQDVNRFKNSFEIRWVIDDLHIAKFDIRLVNENEVQIIKDKTILFDTSLYSADRLIRDIQNIISPPKTIITEELKREIKIHPKIWKHIAKMYDHYYDGMYLDVLLALPLKTDASKLTRSDIVNFWLSLPLEDSLIVIKDILENESAKRDESSNWNYFGDYVKYWRPQLIDFLKDNGIEYNDSSKTFSLIGGEPILITTTKRKLPVLLDIEFNDFFYDALKKEINKAYKFGLFTSTMFLSRKLLENLVIEILRIKYPQNVQGNLDIYYNARDGRFHDFTILLRNFEQKKDDFNVDKQIISEFISLVKSFRPRANSNTHSIVVISNEDEVLTYDIEKMAALLLKLWNNIKSPPASTVK